MVRVVSQTRITLIALAIVVISFLYRLSTRPTVHMASPIKLFTGKDIPSVGLGTWKSDPGAVRSAVITAIEAGYRHIDCAAAYGNEHEVGAGLADVISRGIVRREDLFITSKLWVSKAHPGEVAGALAKTLLDLQTPYVDLYLVHWPFFMAKGSAFPAAEEDRLGYSPAQFLAVWREMEAAVDSGAARHIGTSNMSARKLKQLLADARVQPAVNQVEMHPFLAQQRLVDWSAARGIVTTAYSPLGSPDRPARLVEAGDPTPLSDPVVAGIAAAHGVTPGQVLLRWAVQRGTAVIPKSVTPARIAQNIDLQRWGPLTPADMAALAGLDRGGLAGRIIKGYPFTQAGQAWEALWDEDFDYAA